MEDAVLLWVTSYGYFAIFLLLVVGIVGFGVPDEFLLTSCGFLVYQGHLKLVPTVASALLGSISGITFSYAIGRTAGLKFFRSGLGRALHFKEDHILRVHDWFAHVGHWALVVGYFIPGVRHFTAVVAGTSRLEYRVFSLYAYSGAAVWVATFVFIGKHFGSRWQQILMSVQHHFKLSLIVLLSIAVAYWLLHLLRRRALGRR